MTASVSASDSGDAPEVSLTLLLAHPELRESSTCPRGAHGLPGSHHDRQVSASFRYMRRCRNHGCIGPRVRNGQRVQVHGFLLTTWKSF